jgi:hypothetical protein
MERRAAVAIVVGTVGAIVGIAGAGHVYLRQWRRAAAWFSLVLGASLVLVFVSTDPETVTAETLPPAVVVSVAALLLTSVADAYLVARRRGSRTSGSDGEEPRCPSCGRELDPTLDFCWYCNASVDGADEERDPT